MVEKQLRKYIIPSVLAMVGTSCYILVDTFFISYAGGANGITALNLVLPIYSIIYAIGAMIGIGSSTRYTLDKSMSKGDSDAYFSNAVLWTILVSLIFVTLGIICPEAVLKIMGADEVILSIGIGYIRIVLLFAPCFMLNFVFTSFVRNDNAPKIAMMATLISSIFNIIFDYILMFPFKMGVEGAALATGISPIISMLICMCHYLSKNNTIKFRLLIPSVRKLIHACKLGVVAFVGEIAGGITTMIFNFILLELEGNVAVAAYGVIANIAIVGTAMLNGVAQGLQPLASKASGEEDEDTSRKIYVYSIKVGMLISTVLLLIVWLGNKYLVMIFNSEGSNQLARLASNGLKIYFVGFLAAVINIVRASYYSATGLGKQSSLIAVLRGVVLIIFFAVLLSRFLGINGVWLAFPVAELFTIIITNLVIKL